MELKKHTTVKCLTTDGLYEIVGVPDEGYVIEKTLQPAYVYTNGFIRYIRPASEMEDGRFIVVEKIMQTGTEQLKNQQAIMAAKGFYNGKIDGIWGPDTIAAKIKWERSGKFNPAVPNNGLPLPSKGQLPLGVRRLPDGTMTCPELEVAKTAKTAQAKTELETKTTE